MHVIVVVVVDLWLRCGVCLQLWLRLCERVLLRMHVVLRRTGDYTFGAPRLPRYPSEPLRDKIMSEAVSSVQGDGSSYTWADGSCQSSLGTRAHVHTGAHCLLACADDS